MRPDLPSLPILILAAACSSESANPSSSPDGGNPCTNGACQDAATDNGNGSQPEAAPIPVLVSDPQGEGVHDLQRVGDYLYWGGGLNRIVRAPTAGGAATTLFTHPQMEMDIFQIDHIAVDETGIYFTDYGDVGTRGLYTMPLDGSAAPTLLAAGRSPTSIASDADDVCFTDGDAIRCFNKSSTSTTTVARGVANFETRLAVDRGLVYFQSPLESMADEVYRFPVTTVAPDPDAGSDAGGTPPEKVSIVPGRYVIGLSSHVDNGFIYWGTLDRVYRASATTPATEVIPAASDTSSSSPDALYAFGDLVYWVDTFPPGSVTRMSLKDGTRTDVYQAGGAFSLAADDQYLYAAKGSNILKLPR
jgi:hypothetical protein